MGQEAAAVTRKHPGAGARFAGRYEYVTSCIGSCYEDMRDLLDASDTEHVSRSTFARAVGLEAWRQLKDDLGYDRDFPISRDWHVDYMRGFYRGVACYFLRHSGIEYIYTLDGRQQRSRRGRR